MLGNVVVSATIMKLDQARKCKNINKSRNQSQTCGSSGSVCGTVYECALHPLINTEICFTTNSNNYIK